MRNGGASDPAAQLSPSLPQQQANSQRQKIDQLLADADSNLKKLSGRQLNPSQNDTVGQIRQYIQESKAAAAAGDIDRAYNLALKAHLLSQELAKH